MSTILSAKLCVNFALFLFIMTCVIILIDLYDSKDDDKESK